jgi:hypothetical protein
VYADEGVKVSPAATVIGELNDDVLGGVGKVLEAVRFSSLYALKGL